jgi:ribonuclease HI
VLPVAFYGAQIWWPGATKHFESRLISNSQQGILKAFQKALISSARAILLVYRTTFFPILHKEAGIPFPEHLLNFLALKDSARICRLDPRHPLKARAKACRTARRVTRLTPRHARRWLTLPPTEQLNSIQLPPWHTPESRIAAKLRIGACTREKPLLTRQEAAVLFQTFLDSIPHNDIIIYSDGSKLATGIAGGGYIAFQHGNKITEASIAYGDRVEVFDAEARAAVAGIIDTMSCRAAYHATNIWICLDNQEVALRLFTPFLGSSADTFQEACALQADWAARPRKGTIRVRWVPGHSQVPGNELADALARRGALQPPPPASSPHSWASLKRYIAAQLPQKHLKWWLANAPISYQTIPISTALLPPKELSLPRKALGHLIAARSGHGDFSAYHERFNHAVFEPNCLCGRLKTPVHFFFCRIARRRSTNPLSSRYPFHDISELLGTPEGAYKLTQWWKETSFFEELSPLRLPSLD